MCLIPNANASAKKREAEVTKPTVPVVSKAILPTHSDKKRNKKYDLLYILAPALLCWATPVLPVYAIFIARVIATHALLTFHYLYVDKDNYYQKLPQKQLERERDHYLVSAVLHMWVQVVLQIIFPHMFFNDSSVIGSCAKATFWSHVFIVEPLYYFVHRWLHVPEVMKKMHAFHHLSINTLPTTSLVQNYDEHFVYIVTFGPAFFLPFLLLGCQHWLIIGAYLVLFDLVNAFGHTNIKLRHWAFTHPYSPLRYLFYTPEFHLGHHAYFNANYGLFMPIWDYALGTAREFKKKDLDLKPANQQDFVFVGHNAGLDHLMSCPEISVYNVYNTFRFRLPLAVEFFFMHIVGIFARLFMKNYRVSRYLVDNKFIGRVITIVRTPWDFASPKTYPKMNKEIVELIKDQYKACGTRYFGLGNLTKMKQLNDGGAVIAEMVKQDEFLKDKKIRIWTGDTLTAACVYNQIIAIPDLKEFFFIGANGKIGIAVCKLLLRERPDIKVKIFSRYHGMDFPNVSYTSDLSDILNYKVVVTGKILSSKQYEKAFAAAKVLEASDESAKTRFILDYTVPVIPIKIKSHPEIQHIQIGVLQATSKTFLQGPFDVCMSHDQGYIYPCHTGCILNMVDKRESDEIGEIDVDDMERMWSKALRHGFRNKFISYK